LSHILRSTFISVLRQHPQQIHLHRSEQQARLRVKMVAISLI
jgi:hypothetical protein